MQKGVMFVCTTRPVTRNHIADYSWVVNKSTRGRKEVLQRLSPADLLRLASTMIPKKIISPEFHGRLVAVSRGFTFLAVELLREVVENPEHSILLKGQDELKSLLESDPMSSLEGTVSSTEVKGQPSPKLRAKSLFTLQSSPVRSRVKIDPHSTMVRRALYGGTKLLTQAAKRNFPIFRNKEGTQKRNKKADRETSLSPADLGGSQQVIKPDLFQAQTNKELDILAKRGPSETEQRNKVSKEMEQFLTNNPESKLLRNTLDTLLIGEITPSQGGDTSGMSREKHKAIMVAVREVEQCKDEHTAAEKQQLNTYYDMTRRDEKNSDWGHVSSHGGCNYFVKKDNGSLWQAKSETTAENASPDECLAFITSTSHMLSTTKPAVLSGEKLARINDHSEVVQIKYKFPPPCYNRDLVYVYTWRKLAQKDTIVMGMTSTTNTKSSNNPNVVRMQLKFGVYVFEGISGVGTKISFFFCLDPKGYLAGNMINSQLMNFMSGPSEIKTFYSTKEDNGLPLLKRLLERRLVNMDKEKRLLLGYAAVMGSAIKNAKQLVDAVGEERKKLLSGGERTAKPTNVDNKPRFSGMSVVEISDNHMYRHFTDLVSMGFLDGHLDMVESPSEGLTTSMTTSMTTSTTTSFTRSSTRSQNSLNRSKGRPSISEVLKEGQKLDAIKSFTIRFKHKFVYDCAMRLLPEKHFRLANKLAASLIKKRSIKSSKAFSEFQHHELAKLYSNCGNLQEARISYMLAGNSAMKHGATRDASRMYFNLIEVSHGLETRRSPLRGFDSLQHEDGHLHFMLGLCLSTPLVKQLCFERALQILGQRIVQRGTLKHKAAVLKAKISAHWNPPDQIAKKVTLNTKEANIHVLVAKIWQQMAYLNKQHPKMYMYCNYMQVKEGCRAGVTDELLMGMADLATSFTSLGKFEDAERYLSKIEPLVDVLDNPLSRNCYIFARANLLSSSGNILDSLVLYEECSNGFLLQNGNFRRWFSAEAERLTAMMQVGQLKAAMECCKEDLKQCEDIAEEYLKELFSNLLLLLEARAGSFKSVIELFTHMEDIAEEKKSMEVATFGNSEEMFSKGKSPLSINVRELLSTAVVRVEDNSTSLRKDLDAMSIGATAASYSMHTEDGEEAISAVLKILQGRTPSSAYWWHFETAYWGCCTAVEAYSRVVTINNTERNTGEHHQHAGVNATDLLFLAKK